MSDENKLTRKEELFCQFYVIAFNGADAARRAGYSEKTARNIASEYLTKPHIKARVDELVSQRASITPDQIVNALVSFVTGERGGDREAIKALELLGRAHKLFTDNVNLNADVDIKGYIGVSPDDWSDDDDGNAET